MDRMEPHDHAIKVRMDHVTTSLMERARRYVKLDKSKFIRQSVREKAEAILAEREKTLFTAEDWHMFFAMLDHPPQPTERMKEAARKHAAITDSHAI